MDRALVTLVAFLFAMAFIAALLGYLWIRGHRRQRREMVALTQQFEALLETHKQTLARVQPIVVLDEEVSRLNSQIVRLNSDLQNLSTSYAEKKRPTTVWRVK